MEQKVLIFGEKFIIKNTFHKNKRPIIIDKVEIRRIVLSKKDLYGKKGSFKYHIGYISETNAFLIPLCIALPQMSGYVKYFDSNNKYMNLLVNDKKFLKKYNPMWDKIINLLKTEFDSEPVYDNKYIKTKIKICNNRINTNFQGNKIPKNNEYCTCLSVILLDSAIKIDNDYYSQIFLKECIYPMKKKNTEYN